MRKLQLTQVELENNTISNRESRSPPKRRTDLDQSNGGLFIRKADQYLEKMASERYKSRRVSQANETVSLKQLINNEKALYGGSRNETLILSPEPKNQNYSSVAMTALPPIQAY